ncbi:hypothetical protein GUJ93_ZPchr0010g10843 [Zizania palustris]|uniref:Secreted protein n=1 Tax=Zizania palustris TaxID=103762 RepID=A0A8J5WA87_ZIZPA|nr:hypothetical protein GUJ93_ZPchr0010g10843 [Zizania palustris]
MLARELLLLLPASSAQLSSAQLACGYGWMDGSSCARLLHRARTVSASVRPTQLVDSNHPCMAKKTSKISMPIIKSIAMN